MLPAHYSAGILCVCYLGPPKEPIMLPAHYSAGILCVCYLGPPKEPIMLPAHYSAGISCVSPAPLVAFCSIVN